VNATEVHGKLDSVLEKIKSKISFIGKREEPLSVNDMVVPAIVFVITIYGVFAINYKPIATNLTLIKALNPNNGGLQENLELYKDALDYDSFGNTEVRERLVISASQVIGKQVDPELANSFVTLALEEVDKQIEEMPADAKYRLFAASLLNRLGQVERAREYLFAAKEISPQKEAILFEIGISYINTKEYDKAFDIFNGVYEATPDNKRAAELYILGAISAGHDDLIGEVTEKWGEDILMDRMYINAYARRGETEKVLEIWKHLVDENPGNVQYYISLAATYLMLDMRDEAIEVLESARAIDENLTSQIDFYITEIKAGRNP
jgi:tetratricopeptide (TPR) repeat protein